MHSHVVVHEPLVQYSYYTDAWHTKYFAEVDGYLYFSANQTGAFAGPGFVRLRPDGSLDKSFSVRWTGGGSPYGFNSAGGPRDSGSAIAHAGALLCWRELMGVTVNESARSLARILLKDAPESGFIFRGDPPPSYESGFSALEADGEARIRVLRTGDVNQGAQVPYSTTDGTAHAGEDYEPVTGVLNFAPMEKEKVIVVRLVSTPKFRRTPHFFLGLGQPSSPAAVDQPAQIHILEQEIGFVHKSVLHRLDGSLELLYHISVNSPPTEERLSAESFIPVEKSLDFREWKRVEYGNRFHPYQLIFSPGEKHGFFRAQQIIP